MNVRGSETDSACRRGQIGRRLGPSSGLTGRRIAAAILVAVAVAACGSSSSSPSSKSTQASTSAGANIAAARQLLAPYTGHPSAFPVTQALKKRPKPGTKFAYLQCASPVCAGFATFLKPAAQAMGVRLTITPAGPAADSLQNAMNSIISERPAAVILPGVQFDTILPQLTTLHKLGIPVVAYSLDAAKYHIIPIFDVPKAVRTAGQLMAAWAVSQEGAKTNAVFYTTPEINLSPLEEQAFNAELKHLCASCATRTVTVSITTIGSTAPQAVVSDLQSHPKTNVAVFAIEEAATGLPAAMRAANLQDKVKVVGYGPDPGTLRQIQTGNIAAGGAEDSAIENWTLVDAVARLLTHQALTPAETSGTPPTQMVTAGDLKGKNLTLGYLSYPNYASLFTKAWAGR